MASNFLDTPIEYLKGIGPQKADVLKKEIGVFLFRDLITHYPFRYVDRSKFQTVREINESMPYVQLRGMIESIMSAGDKRNKRLVANFRDNTGTIELVWFQGAQWMADKLDTRTEYIVFGRPAVFKGRYSIAHPEVEAVKAELLSQKANFQSVYSSTEKLKPKGLDSEGLRKLIKQMLGQMRPEMIEENLSDEVREDFKLMPKAEALHQIHFPDSQLMMQKAQYRLKFEELFFVQLKLLRLHHDNVKMVRGAVFNKVGEHFNNFYHNHLPFQLTGAQKRVMKEIRADMGSGHQMNRLLQGDVGSGKTLVALLSMLLAIDNGFQSCLMAPTEILANQHLVTITELLKNVKVKVALLTGSTSKKDRKEIFAQLLSGEINILIGTHALIEDTVQFNNLGLVIIDEQHRFGVAQRAKLRDKARPDAPDGRGKFPPHILIMTATPIPRTLAMTFYGDLDTSVIDEMPPGRKPIKTVHYMETQRLRVIGFMKEQIKLGRQVYVVYPLIQESEKVDMQNLQQGYDNLVKEFPPPQYQISIVHGKLPAQQKDFEMQRFVKGETQIMVATTVIEVGVNIPNASVMVIESAERFGLSQLHQLRGRVGRGAEQSYCILLTSYKLGVDSRTRMETMVRTNDGFEISEVDLKLRGPGDLHGTMQSGVMDLKIADLAQDGQILQVARTAAQTVLNEDPELKEEKNKMIANHLLVEGKNRQGWAKVA
jgi:ATP-dependent DNA helicase RecG